MREDKSFIESKFINSNEIHLHYDLIRFICGHLEGNDASPVVNHISSILADLVMEKDNPALERNLVNIIENMSVTCIQEGSRGTINPHICIYPLCGKQLSTAMKLSRLVVIIGVNKNDPLKLGASTSVVIINIDERYRDEQREVNRLMEALTLAHIHILRISTDGVLCDNICKLHRFSGLEMINFGWLNFSPLHDKQITDLTSSINAWGPEPRLKALRCGLPILRDRGQAIALFIPLIQALSKCIHLQSLTLSGGNLNECVPALMGAPPSQLDTLLLSSPIIRDDVLQSITKAVRQNKLQKLAILGINGDSSISKDALTSLVKAFIDVRPDKCLDILLDECSAELKYLCQATQVNITCGVGSAHIDLIHLFSDPLMANFLSRARENEDAELLSLDLFFEEFMAERGLAYDRHDAKSSN